MADPEPGTPEFWEQYGCEGANEYVACERMSADYARLRRMERRIQALADDYAGMYKAVPGMQLGTNKVASDLRAAMADPEPEHTCCECGCGARACEMCG